MVQTKAGTSTVSALELIREELSLFIENIRTNKGLRVALVSPVVSKKEKEAIVLKITEAMKLSEIVKSVLLVLARKNRFEEIDGFLGIFDSVRAEIEGRFLGKIESAHTISDADVLEITKAFEKKLSKSVTLHATTDEALLGGIRVTVGGVTYDRTLRSQVKRLRESVLESLR